MTDAVVLSDHDDLTSWEAQPSAAHPHLALLLGAGLATVVLVCVLPVPMLHLVRPEYVTVYLVVAALVGLSSMAPFLNRRARSRWYVSYAIVAFDALPLLMAAVAVPGTPTRPWASLIIVPVLLTASTSISRWFRAELVVGTALGFLLLIAAAPSVIDAVVTCAGFLFFLLVCATLTRQDWVALHARFDELQRRSRIDELTGLLNRRGLVDRFDDLRRTAAEGRQPLGMVMIDIDHFSQINAEAGHAYGDQVLQQLCELVSAQPVLQGGLVARIGGEELVVIVAAPAEPVAEAIGAAVRNSSIHRGLSVSMGISDSDPGATTDEDALWRQVNLTDAAMYRAKHAGRNRMVRATADDADVDAPVDLPRRPGARRIRPYRDPRGLLDPNDTSSLQDRLDFRVFGIFELVFSIIGFLAYTGGVAFDHDSRWATTYLAILPVSGVLGLIAIRQGRRVSGRFATLIILVGELNTIAGILATADLEYRMLEACLLATPALVAAHALSRRWALFHGLLVYVGAALAAWSPDPADGGGAGWAYRTLSLGLGLGAAPAVLLWLRERRAVANSRLRLLTALDPLTGVHNRAGLERVVLTAPFDQRLQVLAVNINGFKRLNDTYGHAFGDDTLRLLAGSLDAAVADHLRMRESANNRGAGPAPGDPLVARTGGDRFVIVHPGSRDEEMIRRVRQTAGLPPNAGSVSFGFATGHADDAAALWALVAEAEDDLGRRTAPL